MRYAALGLNGQQWASSPLFLQKLRERLGIETEAFASPLNRFFPKYYSVFTKDQASFGSLGNFFDSAIDPDTPVYANPPFTPAILERTIDYLCGRGFDKVVLVTPRWEDAAWYQKLLRNGYTSSVKNDVPYLHLGTIIYPKIATILWCKWSDPKFASDDILKLW